MTMPRFLLFCLISCASHVTNAWKSNQFRLDHCNPRNTHQIFSISHGVKHANRSVITFSKDPDRTNMDCDGCTKLARVWNYRGSANADSNTNRNQWWNVIRKSSFIILQSLTEPDFCVTSAGEEAIYGAPIMMDNCQMNSKGFQWVFESSTGLIHSAVNNSLCIDQEWQAPPVTPCYDSPTNSKFAFCDDTLDTASRVQDLISRMTIMEKAYSLWSHDAGIPRLGVPRNHFTEALHGVIAGCGKTYNGNTGCPTSFPHALALGATFNRTLWRVVSTYISTEARGLNNQGLAGLFYWAPDINLFRDPRWGRGQEVPGEDPFLTGEYVMHYSRGMQEGAPGSDTRYLKVVSTAKHYADYDMENFNGLTRQDFNAIVTDQDQVEYYWPAWRAAIEGAHVRSVMCSYNAVNGVPSCGNQVFMDQVLRGKWQFDGFVVSDCGAVDDLAFKGYIQKLYNGSIPQHIRVAMEAGCDVNCGDFYPAAILEGVNASVLPVSVVDEAARRLYSLSMELGMFDKNCPYQKIDYKQVDTPEHRKTALQAGQQAVVLLKNDKNILPIAKSTKVALIGPHFNATLDMLSNYHGSNKIVMSHSPLDGFKNYGANIVGTAFGCNLSSSDTSGFAEAKNVAMKADVVFIFVGLTPTRGYGPATESEGTDRPNVKFPGVQQELIAFLASTGKPIVVVLINGGAIDISVPKKEAAAILEAFYPGEFGGDVIASIVYGDISPAGKLVTTVYDSSIDTARNITNMNLRANGGITYRYYKGTPLYPFGFGLSYTTFSYQWEKIVTNRVVNARKMASLHPSYIGDNKRKLMMIGAISYKVIVKNTGKVASDCVVLGFLSAQSPDAPLKELFDFDRVSLRPGESATIYLTVPPEVLSLVDRSGREYIAPETYRIWIGDAENHVLDGPDLIVVGEEETVFSL